MSLKLDEVNHKTISHIFASYEKTGRSDQKHRIAIKQKVNTNTFEYGSYDKSLIPT